MSSTSEQQAKQTAEASGHSEEEIAKAHKILYDIGIQNRYAVAGKSYVDKSLAAGSSAFAKPMQEFVTESCWGSIWSRPGISRKQRSLLNIAMLCCLNRSTELGVHVRGAVNNGCSQVEIRETILHAACYAGMPAGIEGFKVAERVIKEIEAEGVKVKWE
jgi:4-carboxymuconolactone decarboxylase